MITEVGKKVVISYQADVAQAQANVRSLGKEQEKHAKSMRDNQESEIKGLEEKISRYGKYAIAATAAYAAVRVAIDSLDFFYERAELRQKAEGQNINMLREATRGLVGETDLLKLASAANNGVMRASSAQLVTMAKAVDVLGGKGFETNAVLRDFNAYLQTGQSGPLKNYGIKIDEARGSAAQFGEVLKQVTVIAQQHDAAAVGIGDSWKKTKVMTSDAIERLKESMGKFVATVEPYLSGLLELATSLIDKLSELMDFASQFSVAGNTDANIASMVSDAEQRRRDRVQLDRAIEESRIMREGDERTRAFIKNATPEQLAEARKLGDQLGKMMNSGISAGIGTAKEWLKGSKKKKGGGTGRGDVEVSVEITFEDPAIAIEERAKRDADAYAKRVAAYAKSTAKMRAELIDPYQADFSGTDIDKLPQLMHTAEELRAEYAQFTNDQSQSVMRKMFGDPQELNVYASGLQALQAAGTAAFQAMMTGSEGAGEAFRRMLASNMMGLASEMFGKSIYHGAMALGSLAMLDGRGAAMHGAAAAKFAGGALVLGGIAASMGGSGSAASGGASSAALPSTTSAAINTPATEARGKSVTVVVGDDFADDSPRKRQQRAERMVKLGLRTDSEVTYS
jgi:hypothetical protein